jgi:hypothetical protein
MAAILDTGRRFMQIRKKGGWNLKKIFSETTEPISTKLFWNDPWVVLFQICIRQHRLVSKMAAITKNRTILDTGRRWRTQFWKETTQGSFQQSLVEIGSVVSEEFKPESAQIWTV